MRWLSFYTISAHSPIVWNKAWLSSQWERISGAGAPSGSRGVSGGKRDTRLPMTISSQCRCGTQKQERWGWWEIYSVYSGQLTPRASHHRYPLSAKLALSLISEPTRRNKVEEVNMWRVWVWVCERKASICIWNREEGVGRVAFDNLGG